ncbi:hypothetical protein BHE74_00013862 [Ensete ventricosum]|uniref:Uncharacterized protein n=1 Tax=Ensete ventricosum TaxID=4639 RepID=A0A426Z5E0_ENSVE|nr:hypothetical protein B296_00022127 [Ensete ventricosum]RWW03029.1 hypothetical protein GW17_00033855 [Ensete ventricosum]RWW77944.1 hypothetical protein BHE74_00013862 [Ensete ventricosum]RZR89371.1 hypothetical protein BHM03_00017074 [Ensete ventricosum]
MQSHTLKSYPAELSLTTLICLTGTGQAGAVALFMERGAKPWSIGFDMRLFTAVYSVRCFGDQMNTSTENSEKTKAVDDAMISNSIDYVTVVDIPPEKKPEGTN